MGFLPQSSWEVPTERPLSEAVGRALRSCGITPPDTLNDPSEHTSMAIGAVDAAAQRIWYAARWDWRSLWIPFELGVGATTAFYRLPSRYDNSGANPVCGYLENPLTPISYEELTALVPTFSMIPVDQMGGLDSLVETLTDFASDDRNFGLPTHWGIHGGHLFLYPIPNDVSLYEGIGFSGTRLPFMFNFYATYEPVLGATEDGTDVSVPIPQSMAHIMHFLAAGYLQGDLEFPGASKNEARGEALLQAEVARHRKLKRDSSFYRDTSDRRYW